MQSLTETEIRNFISTQLKNTEVNTEEEKLTLIECQFKPGQSLLVCLDHVKGVSLEKCQIVHRIISDFLDKHGVDVAIEVSSYDISEPFLLPLHYQKNINRKVEGKLRNNDYFFGLLTDFKNEKIQISLSLEGKPKRKEKKEEDNISWIDIEEIQWIKLKF